MARAHRLPVRSNWSDETWIHRSLIYCEGARFVVLNYEPLGVVVSGARASLFGYAGPSLPRLPLRLFRAELGPLPSKILAAMVEQAGRLTLTSRAFHRKCADAG